MHKINVSVFKNRTHRLNKKYSNANILCYLNNHCNQDIVSFYKHAKKQNVINNIKTQVGVN